MKAIVVYYSLDGNSEYVADIIAQSLNAQKLKLEPVKEYPKGNVIKYLWGGKSVVFGEKPKLTSYQFNAEEYDLIIIGTPIWAGSFAPPINTFLKEKHLSRKKIALYACCSGGDAQKCFEKIRKILSDCDIITTMTLLDPKVKPSSENTAKVSEFCSQLK